MYISQDSNELDGTTAYWYIESPFWNIYGCQNGRCLFLLFLGGISYRKFLRWSWELKGSNHLQIIVFPTSLASQIIGPSGETRWKRGLEISTLALHHFLKAKLAVFLDVSFRCFFLWMSWKQDESHPFFDDSEIRWSPPKLLDVYNLRSFTCNNQRNQRNGVENAKPNSKIFQKQTNSPLTLKNCHIRS